MCWIMVKPASNEVPYDYIEQAQTKNKDGYGVSWYADGAIHTFKTLDFEEFNAKLETIENYLMVVHLRNATVGTSSCTTNVHPFPVPTGVMFHNGTISSLRCSTSVTSDTNQLAQAISECSFTHVSDVAPLLQIITGSSINRLVFLNNDGTVDIINRQLGIEDPNGNWYSNDYHVKEATYNVFVYGTLKAGYSNNPYYMYMADFVDDATTVEKFAMIGEDMAFPYILGEDPVDGHNIIGELYSCPQATLDKLDKLEGYPVHYDRRSIKIKLSDDTIVDALVYIKKTVTAADLLKPFIAEFTRRSYYTTYRNVIRYSDYDTI